jgi:hypothetical protein
MGGQALDALAAVPAARWDTLSEWLDQHVVGSGFLRLTGTTARGDAPGTSEGVWQRAIKRGSWITAETDSIRYAHP